MPMPIDVLIHSAGQLLTLPGGPQRSTALGTLGLIADGAVAIQADRIIATGPTTALQRQYQARQTIDASGQVVMPGFVDPHTHAAWAAGVGQRVGSLEVGKQADILVLDVPDYRHVGYRFGTNLVHTVVKAGRLVVARP